MRVDLPRCVATWEPAVRFGYGLPMRLALLVFLCGAQETPFIERMATQLERSFATCEGVAVKRSAAAVELQLPRPCRLGSRVVSGTARFEVVGTGAVDAPVRSGQQLKITARAFAFDAQQFDGVLLEGVLKEGDSIDVTLGPSRAKVKALPVGSLPRAGRVESPTKDPRIDPIGDAASGTAQFVGALPSLVPAVAHELVKGADATVFAAQPGLVAVWLLAGDPT